MYIQKLITLSPVPELNRNLPLARADALHLRSPIFNDIVGNSNLLLERHNNFLQQTICDLHPT